MKLRNIEFGDVFVSPPWGSRSLMFFGQTLSKETRIYDTVSLHAPEEKNHMLRKIGAGTLLATNTPAPIALVDFFEKISSEKKETPYILSITSRAETKEGRLAQMQEMIDFLRGKVSTGVGLELDFSWPDDAFDQNELSDEIREVIVRAAVLEVPLIVKISILMSPDIASDILTLDACDALNLSNSIPWSALAEDAKKIFFRTDVSPLEEYGGGRVSGKYLLHLTCEWIKQFRRGGSRKPIIADGGILRVGDVKELKEAGVTAIVLGSIFSLRPWNIVRVLTRIKKQFS